MAGARIIVISNLSVIGQKFKMGITLGCPCSKLFHSTAGFSLRPLSTDNLLPLCENRESMSAQKPVQMDIPMKSNWYWRSSTSLPVNRNI